MDRVKFKIKVLIEKWKVRLFLILTLNSLINNRHLTIHQVKSEIAKHIENHSQTNLILHYQTRSSIRIETIRIDRAQTN